MSIQELKELLKVEYHYDRGMMDGIAKVIRTIEQMENQENAAEIERREEKAREWFGEETAEESETENG